MDYGISSIMNVCLSYHSPYDLSSAIFRRFKRVYVIDIYFFEFILKNDSSTIQTSLD